MEATDSGGCRIVGKRRSKTFMQEEMTLTVIVQQRSPERSKRNCIKDCTACIRNLDIIVLTNFVVKIVVTFIKFFFDKRLSEPHSAHLLAITTT